MFKIKAKKISSQKGNKGFALLFAVLTASLLLAIGLSIFRLSFKELTIAIAARDSQIAFYAADSARECALYWDTKIGAFPTCLNEGCSLKTTSTQSEITCGLATINISTDQSSNPMTYTYSRAINPFLPFITYDSIPDSIEPEADLTLIKFYNGSSHNIETTVSAYGHNVGIIGRRLERGIVQNY